MRKIVKSLIAIISGSAVFLIPLSGANENYRMDVNYRNRALHGRLIELRNYVPPPLQKREKEKPLQTAYLNMVGAFGKPETEIGELADACIT